MNLAGGNPYSWHELLAAERLAEPSMPTPVLMWNPPWTLALAALPSLLPFQQSRALWLVVSSLAVAVSASQLWRFWGGRSGRLLAVVAAALAFPPSVFALAMGQMSPLLLLGVAGFLHFERRGRLEAAGAVAAVTLVKPQVVYLLWVALLLWSLHGRRWRFLAGAAASIAAMSAVPLATNPGVFLDYLRALSGRAPDYFVTPTAGTLLRLLVGWEYTWLMFAPVPGRPRVASPALVRAPEELAMVGPDLNGAVGVGGDIPVPWLFDQVVLLLPALQIAVVHGSRPSRQTRRALAVYGAAVVAAFVMLPWNVIVRDVASAPKGLLREALTTPNMFWHVLIAPVLLAGLLALRRSLTQTPGDIPLGDDPAINRED